MAGRISHKDTKEEKNTKKREEGKSFVSNLSVNFHDGIMDKTPLFHLCDFCTFVLFV
jgi:hypothetical protein